MAAVSLFWNTNMAAVTSGEYALYDYRCFVMDVKIPQVGIGWNNRSPSPLFYSLDIGLCCDRLD